MDRRSFFKSAGAVSAVAATSVISLEAMAQTGGNTSPLAAGGESLATSKNKPLFSNNPQLTPMRGFSGQDVSCDNLAIEGKIPAELRGIFYRNGPGLFERNGQRYQHWFDGDGLVNQWRFTDKGVSHQARFVRTEKFVAEAEANDFLFPVFGSRIKAKRAMKNSDSVNTANTSVVKVGDKLLAMWEGGSAYELDPITLETRGAVVWKPELKAMPFSAHPKVEADGTFWNFGTLMMGKTVLYHISAKGDLLRYHLIDAPPSAMVHDFAVSQKHIIFLLAPITLDQTMLRAGAGFGESMKWNNAGSTKVLIVDKADFTKQRILELPPFMVFHFGNAWEENNVIRVDFVKSNNLNIMSDYMPKIMRGELTKSAASNAAFLKIDLNSGKLSMETREEQLEFPRVDPRFVAARNRYVFYPTFIGREDTRWGFNAVMRLDVESGKTDTYSFGEDFHVEEHIVVGRPDGTKEGDGWLIGVGFDVQRQQTFATVFDALNLKAGPVAIARLPYWMPTCFHGNFHQA